MVVVLSAALVLAVVGWIGGRGAALACVAVRPSGCSAAPGPRAPAACVGGALAVLAAAGCLLVFERLAQLIG